jgi:hypothetical protein
MLENIKDEEQVLKCPYEEVCRTWLVAMRTAAAVREMFTENSNSAIMDSSWQFASFFMDIIIKSMAQRLQEQGVLGNNC